MAEASDGLEGVVAARTILSEVDGEAGRLVIRGSELADLVGKVGFEAITRRLWEGFFDPLAEDLAPALGKARADVFVEVEALEAELIGLSPMAALQSVSARFDQGEDLDAALRLLAAPAVVTAALVRRKRGEAALRPDPDLTHAADILRMMRGAPAEAGEAAALDAYLVTVVDHGLNASTFAARVVASTHASLAAAVSAAIGALSGPLHGGAPGPVIEMLDAIGHPQWARAWLEAALDRGERLMGFGHRIYRARDPRADALKAEVRKLARSSDQLPGRLAFADAVEKAALEILAERKPQRSLQTNVEFYTALLLEALGIAPEVFTCVFAMGRTPGWIAHAQEQKRGGRLIRPQSIYIGPRPEELGSRPAIRASGEKVITGA
ncbi:MAG: citrate synthase [Caulobacteraceae bacterium]